MKIYLKYNAESEKYAQLVKDSLQKSGHNVFIRGEYRNDKESIKACHVCMDLTVGKLAETVKPEVVQLEAPKGLRKDVDDRVQKLVLVLGKKQLPRRQLVAELGLKQNSRRDFIYNYFKPAMSRNLICLAYPNVPKKPDQAYRLTEKGLDLYDELTV